MGALVRALMVMLVVAAGPVPPRPASPVIGSLAAARFVHHVVLHDFILFRYILNFDITQNEIASSHESVLSGQADAERPATGRASSIEFSGRNVA